jgi:hypothetical protein
VSSNKLTLIGLEELKHELAKLPDELVGEGSAIVTTAATGARDEIAANYQGHSRSGGLANGLELRTRDTGGKSVGLVVRNRAKDAHLFEDGTQARHNNLGANRGSMPAAHAFVPPIIRHRREMYQQLKALLERKGLTVTGEA